MTLQRTHILLKPDQHRLLAEIARREGRSISDLAREIIQQGLLARQDDLEVEQKLRLAALENAQRVRQSILDERGGELIEIDAVELIREMREERINDILSHSG